MTTNAKWFVGAALIALAAVGAFIVAVNVGWISP